MHGEVKKIMDSNRLTQLESLLRTGSTDQCRQAIDELAQCPAELAVPVLQRLSGDRDFLRRRFAVMGLGNHRTEASLAVLKALLEQETDDNVMAEIANSLFEFGDVAVPLLEQLFYRNHNWLTRQTIVAVLMEANDDRALLSVIREALHDETQSVKETAILALGKLMAGALQGEAVDLLVELAKAKLWRDRWRAATALCLSTDPRAKSLLAQLQQDENHYVVAAAALESEMGTTT
jgi:HEAT repeat protein